ncbi:MAG TPA: VWA domain-containing protein [Thermoanaerobaculia bacterium]|nr:VWA domain-containing protein [Thermoanaerobaculia bacterium]
MRRVAVLVATLVVATGILAEKNKDAAKADVQRKLTRRERNARIEKLDVRHQDFVADVEPIIVPAELDAFLMMETDAQRDSFIDDFWRRRDRIAGTTNLAFKDMYYHRLDAAKERFRKLGTDRAKIFLLHGPPAEVVRSECQRLLQPIEIWKYPALNGVGYGVRLLFYKPRFSNEYKLWNPIGGAGALADLLASGDTADASSSESSLRRELTESASPYAYISRIQLECRDGDEIMRAVTQMVQTRVDLLKLFEPPALNDEEVQKMLSSVVIANPAAPKLTADFNVQYPGKQGSRTDVQMQLAVPRAQVTPAESGGAEVYTIDVTGEVLKEGQLWEKYRYRFDFPGDYRAEKLPIVIDRFLRPAEYVSRIKVIDANTGAEVIVENPITVPEVFVPEPAAAVAEAAPAPAPALAPTPAPVAAAVETPVPSRPALRLVPPANEPVSGVQTIETLVSGDAIKAVEFSLDGRRVAVRRTAPYSLDLDFGIVPTMRRIRAVALDAAGKPLVGDDIVVNTGTDPFRVRIVSPRIAPHLVGAARIEMDVSVPDGEELAGLEVYWNETRIATLYDPPFVQMIDIPATDGVGYVRAVAKLKDESIAPVEDVVMINTPAYMEELNVHLIELPATVLVNGKPADNLTEKSFKILDDGKNVPIAKFEYVKNLPLSIGMAFDASGSMASRMDEAQKAGAQFFETVMKRGDKAFLVAFNKDTQTVQKWTTKLADVHAGLARLRAEATTALYDAIVHSLYQFHGVKGQKALIVISDGRDTDSKFTFDQAMEYARRAAVPIYTIGIGVKGGDVDVRYKLGKLSTETGGTTYYIEQARELQHVYDDIQSELRSQYILGFYPAQDVKPGKWRELVVQANEGKVKTVKGYFP